MALVRDYRRAIHHLSGRLTGEFYNASFYQDDEGHVLRVLTATHDLPARKPDEVKQRSDSGPVKYEAPPIFV